MLNNLSKQTKRIIPLADCMGNNIFVQKRRIGKKLANPRLLQTTFTLSDTGKAQWNITTSKTSSMS